MNIEQILSVVVFTLSVVNVFVIIRIESETRREAKRILAILDQLDTHIKILEEHFKHVEHILDSYNEQRRDDWWRQE